VLNTDLVKLITGWISLCIVATCQHTHTTHAPHNNDALERLLVIAASVRKHRCPAGHEVANAVCRHVGMSGGGRRWTALVEGTKDRRTGVYGDHSGEVKDGGLR